MIIKGNPAGSVAFWSKHLMRDDTNERVKVVEIGGLLAEDLPTALREMEAIAAGSRSHGNFMYQANISPRADEHLTDRKWKEAVDTLEKNLGLEGHQRVVVEHEKEGRTHRHVVWNRVDVDNLRVVDMGGNWRVHTATARELENRFDLSPTPTPAALDRKPALELWEVRAAERSGIDPAALKEELSELWRRTDNGKAFAAAVEERGYVLARGDRRDFCIVDQAGDAHSLARRLDGVRAKDVRERMADIDRDSLPSVAEARASQREAAKERPEASATTEQPKDIFEAWRKKEAARQAEGTEPIATPEPKATAAPDRDAPSANEPPKDMFEAWRTKEAMRRDGDNDAFWQSVNERRDGKTEAVHSHRRKETAEKVSQGEDAPSPVGAALSVVDAVTGTAEKLTDFVLSFLGGGASQPSQDPATVDAWAELKAQRKAAAALDNIRESMERGESLSASDIRNLTPMHLQNIASHGDDYLRQLIERIERDRQRENDWGRERER
jgi:hypothetical protein